ncbi:glycosyltransferase [Vibrio sp. S4M6]|uniref:MJ1255/VC2487 family glycosyltransferase n=1 Tax=Vibrio sinus TaxID=2946865 RepID=UPI00202A98A8|nr:MJ1255/VC2487 family glycosyltransferase [Vibrio sinus]MCL9781571.1 glycosyltransferase [Vibrio sinus]
MKVLYGVQGTGNGHIARARVMHRALKEKGVEVDLLFSGREKDKYFSMDDFGDYQTCRGLTFVTENGKIDHIKTVAKNSAIQFSKEVKQLDLTKYDAVLNDFEPVSAWAAKRNKVPCIGISHQNAFRYHVPTRGVSWLDRQIIEYFAPSTCHIGLHWYHFDQPLLPPIIDTLCCSKQSDDYLLIYLPFENLQQVMDLCHRFVTHKFVCYHPDVTDTHQVDNIELKPLNYTDFQQHLACCLGVIANGGFELPSEALVRGKKLLLKPLTGQFEQVSNADTLEALGLASTMEHLDAAKVRQWLDEENPESIHYPDVASPLVDWIISANWSNTESLSHQLWEQVDFPSYVSHS